MRYLVFVLLILSARPAFAGETDFEKRMVNAVYNAEGGANTNYPYGIKSIKTKNPREACRQTIVNNMFRFLESTEQMDEFLTFLQRRYAPLNAEDDPEGLNQNWKKNVSRLYHGQSYSTEYAFES